jgi:hypothetical protein
MSVCFGQYFTTSQNMYHISAAQAFQNSVILFESLAQAGAED